MAMMSTIKIKCSFENEDVIDVLKLKITTFLSDDRLAGSNEAALLNLRLALLIERRNI